MNLRVIFSVLSLQAFSAPVWAVPGQFTHQGRLLDAEGEPLSGDLLVTFRLMDAAEDGGPVWEEDLAVTLTHGFYSVVLGADEDGNPLDVDVLALEPVWLEVQIDGESPMSPRSAVGSVPYATLAGEAESVVGGPVDATTVAISGSPVIDADGQWVGPTPAISWDDIADKPDDFGDGIDRVLSASEVLDYVDGSTIDLGTGSTLDGVPLATTEDLVMPTWDTLEGVPEDFRDGVDDDVLASLGTSCIDGDVPRWSEDVLDWVCGEDVDTVLSVEEVRGFVTDGAIDLAAGSTVGGESIATGEHTTSLGWDSITGIPDGFADGVDDDNQLSASEVLAYIVESAIDLAAGTTVGGEAILTGEHTSSLAWSALTEIPDGFADGIDDDTTLEREDVIGFVTEEAVDFAPGTTIGGAEIATGSGVPSGLIVMWSGTTPPEGWTLCDGSDGSPDLRDRFVLGSGSSYGSGSTGGGTGGVGYSTATAHHWGSSGLTVVTSVSGGGGLPPYYALAFIMKL